MFSTCIEVTHCAQDVVMPNNTHKEELEKVEVEAGTGWKYIERLWMCSGNLKDWER